MNILDFQKKASGWPLLSGPPYLHFLIMINVFVVPRCDI